MTNETRSRFNDSAHSPLGARTRGAPALAMAGLALALFAGCEAEPLPKPPNPGVEKRLQDVLEGSVGKPDAAFAGAIAHYHTPAYRPWSGAAGLGDVAGAVAMRPRDRFRAGSILKTFLATVTLQHVEEGALSLDATLPALLPASVTARVANADQISLRMLLNHTSGIPEWMTPEVEAQVAADPARIWSPDEALDIASRIAPSFPPGTSWTYSNTDYTLLGLVLDGLGGRPWRAQVRERLLDRLGLEGTSLPEPGDTTIAGAHAHGYQVIGDQVVDLTGVDPSMAGAAGGGALVTTAEDLGTFIEALLAGELFARPATLAAMQTMVDAPDPSGLPHRYGLGLEEYTLPDGAVITGHAGSTAGFAAMMFRIPAADTTLITAINTQDLFANALDVFSPAAEVVTGMAR